MTETWWVASANPVKARAVELALRRLYPARVAEIRPLPLPSGVAAQPIGEVETRRGAYTRAAAAHRRETKGDGWVGLEGGVAEIDGRAIWNCLGGGGRPLARPFSHQPGALG